MTIKNMTKIILKHKNDNRIAGYLTFLTTDNKDNDEIVLMYINIEEDNEFVQEVMKQLPADMKQTDKMKRIGQLWRKSKRGGASSPKKISSHSSKKRSSPKDGPVKSSSAKRLFYAQLVDSDSDSE